MIGDPDVKGYINQLSPLGHWIRPKTSGYEEYRSVSSGINGDSDPASLTGTSVSFSRVVLRFGWVYAVGLDPAPTCKRQHEQNNVDKPVRPTEAQVN